VTRVNSVNVLDEGLRIRGRGRRMNSKVKIRQTRQSWMCVENKRSTQLAQSRSVPGRHLLVPLYRWPVSRIRSGSIQITMSVYDVISYFNYIYAWAYLAGPRGTKIMVLISYTLVSSPLDSTRIVDSGWISNLHIFDLINLWLLLFPYMHQTIHIIYLSRGFWLTILAVLTDQETS
jgi:hypothetical protein